LTIEAKCVILWVLRGIRAFLFAAKGLLVCVRPFPLSKDSGKAQANNLLFLR
jgi:hypothetical protein